MYLQMETGKSAGWTRAADLTQPFERQEAVGLPTAPTQPGSEEPQGVGNMPLPTPLPVPMPVPPPLPTPPLPTPPAESTNISGEKCGFCITLGMAYVPPQKWRMLYEPKDGFARGTIFEELDFPFVGKGECRHD